MSTDRSHSAHIHARPTTTRRRREGRRPEHDHLKAAPIVAAVDGTPAAIAVAEAAVGLGRDLSAPVVFVYVRRGPSPARGEPYYQRRLDAEMRVGRRALGKALAIAKRASVRATGEELAGGAARRIVEFASGRGARLVVLGTRRRWLRRSVSRAVIRQAYRPVIVAPAESIDAT